MNIQNKFFEIPRLLSVNTLYTAHIRNYDENFYFTGETHDFWELIYIIRGKATIAKDDTIYHLSTGDIAFHRPMEFHRLWANDSSFSPLVITFVASGSVLNELANNIHTLNITQENLLIQLKQEIDESFTYEDKIRLKPKPDAALEAQMAVTKLELFLLDILKSKNSEERIDNTKTAMTFSQIVKIMNEHLSENLSIDDIAKLCNLSVANLKKICHKYTGTGPAKHFTKLKIIYAISLLKTGYNVTEVSDKLGFTSQSYFSVVFKQKTGYSPTSLKDEQLFEPSEDPIKSSEFHLCIDELTRESAC